MLSKKRCFKIMCASLLAGVFFQQKVYAPKEDQRNVCFTTEDQSLELPKLQADREVFIECLFDLYFSEMDESYSIWIKGNFTQMMNIFLGFSKDKTYEEEKACWENLYKNLSKISKAIFANLDRIQKKVGYSDSVDYFQAFSDNFFTSLDLNVNGTKNHLLKLACDPNYEIRKVANWAYLLTILGDDAKFLRNLGVTLESDLPEVRKQALHVFVDYISGHLAVLPDDLRSADNLSLMMNRFLRLLNTAKILYLGYQFNNEAANIDGFVDEVLALRRLMRRESIVDIFRSGRDQATAVESFSADFKKLLDKLDVNLREWSKLVGSRNEAESKQLGYSDVLTVNLNKVCDDIQRLVLEMNASKNLRVNHDLAVQLSYRLVEQESYFSPIVHDVQDLERSLITAVKAEDLEEALIQKYNLRKGGPDTRIVKMLVQLNDLYTRIR